MIFDRAIRHAKNQGAPGYDIMTLDDPAGWAITSPGALTSAGAMKLSAVNACVECLSNSMAKLPYFLMDSATKKRMHHPIIKLLTDRPNEAMTPSVYKKLVECQRLMRGNGYAYINRRRNDKEPVELIPLLAEYTEPFLDSNGKLWYIFSNPRTGTVHKLDNFDVLHYKAYSHDGITGISVLERASEVIQTARTAQQYESRLYSQGARPSGILQAKEVMASESKEKVRKEWERLQSGVDNAFRIAVLDMGLEYKQISMSNKDTQFVESKAITVEDITRFFGVPLYKINAGKQTYASNEQNGIEYVVNTLHPIVTQYEEEDTYKLLFDRQRQRNLQIRINMMAELRGDFGTRGTWYRNMRETGVFSVNDILDLEDMPAVPGGDTRYASLNYIPLELFRELSISRNQEGGDHG